jgi:hypothetical protein
MSAQFKVIYNVKHINKKSALYGLVSFDQTCTFATLKDAFRFAKEMKGRRTSKIEVLGIPTIERM